LYSKVTNDVSSRRKQTWIALIVLAVSLPLAAILGLFTYMVVTSTPLHPDKEKVPSVVQSTPSPKWVPAVEQGRQIARAGIIDQNLPGLSVAVGVDGTLVWAEGFGWADLDQHVKVTPETLFRIGTASKVLTSVAVGLLVEKGQLKLDDAIQVYVPEFPEKQWPVTLRQVMGHLAGIRNDAGDEEPRSVASGCGKTIEGLQRFAARPLLFEPGSKYRYSNYGWILVSAAVEAAAKEPFYKFMREQIFEPLGMGDTMADSATEPIPDRATFYFPRFAADPRYGPQDPEVIDYSCFAGSSAFLSTPSDLVRFGMAINRGKLLQPTTVHLLQASQRLPSGQETGYGLGWDLETVTLSGTVTTLVGHDGELMGGKVASFATFPDQGIVVAVISNTAFAKTFALASSIAQSFAH
jgi:serine beta-lactamase-like protein LACTB